MKDDDDNVIDIEAEEKGKETRRERAWRRRRARTGANGEKPTSKVFWIVVGSVLAVVTIRVFEKYFPKQPAALPPSTVVPVAATELDLMEG